MPAPIVDSRRAPEHLAFTSYLRVLAIGAVVLIHVMASMATNEALRGSGRWWVANILDSGSSWSVPVFMMVSGALVLAPTPHPSPGEFYRRRLRRIAIPLLTAHVLYFAARVVLLHQAIGPAAAVRDVLQLKVAAHLYFFWIIAGLYLVAPLLRAFIAMHSGREVRWLGVAGIVWMLLVTLSTGLLHSIGSGSPPWAPPLFTLFLPYIGYFVLGYALRDVLLRRTWAIVAFVIFLIADAAHVWSAAVGAHGALGVLLSGGYQGVPVAITALTFFLVGRAVISPGSVLASRRAATIARRVGDLALGVFVIHLLVKLAAQRTILAHGRSGQILGDALLLYAVVLIGSFAVCAIIARVPILRRSIGL